MIETINIKVTTPTLTPRIVSAERSLFAQTVSTAISADSLMSSSFKVKFLSIPLVLFCSLYWVLCALRFLFAQSVPQKDPYLLAREQRTKHKVQSTKDVIPLLALQS